jgi:hypothetical protein
LHTASKTALLFHNGTRCLEFVSKGDKSMSMRKLAILPAALALCLAAAPAAYAGPDKNHGDGGPDKSHNPDNGGGPDKNHNPGGGGGDGGPDKNHGDGGGGDGGPDKNPNPAPNPAPAPRPNPAPVNFGNGDGYPRDVLCRLDGRIIYVRTERKCRQLQRELGAGDGTVIVVQERKRMKKRKVRVQQVVVVDGGYEQPQPVVRYVAQPSLAARMQMERRGAYAGDGGVVAYGNGVVVGGYNNTVVVNGNVYGGGQVVVSGKKRKLKKVRRDVVQQPQYYYDYSNCRCAN